MIAFTDQNMFRLFGSTWLNNLRAAGVTYWALAVTDNKTAETVGAGGGGGLWVGGDGGVGSGRFPGGAGGSHCTRGAWWGIQCAGEDRQQVKEHLEPCNKELT